MTYFLSFKISVPFFFPFLFWFWSVSSKPAIPRNPSWVSLSSQYIYVMLSSVSGIEWCMRRHFLQTPSSACNFEENSGRWWNTWMQIPTDSPVTGSCISTLHKPRAGRLYLTLLQHLRNKQDPKVLIDYNPLMVLEWYPYFSWICVLPDLETKWHGGKNLNLNFMQIHGFVGEFQLYC